MTTVVLSETVLLSEEDLKNSSCEGVIKTRTSLKEHPRALSFYSSEYITGVSKNGKRWYRWRTIGSQTYKLTKAKNIVRVDFDRKGKTFYTKFFYDEQDKFKTPYLREKWGELATFEKQFPAAAHYGVANCARMNNELAKIFRSKTARDITINTFGKNSLRKDLIKAVANTTVEQLGVAKILYGHIPTDWIVEFLNISEGFENRHSFSTYYLLSQKNYAHGNLLEVIGPVRFRRMLLSIRNTADVNVFKDLWRCQIREDNFERVRNARTLMGIHDAAWRQPTRTPASMRDFELEVSTFAKSIDGLFIDDMHIVIPKTYHELIDWSNTMGNCIRSYARDTHITPLGAIMHDDKMVANFQVVDGAIQQLLGRHNQTLEPNLRAKIEEFFEAFSINTDNYWGKRGVDTAALV